MVNISTLSLTHHHHKGFAWLCIASQLANYEEHSYPQSLKQSTVFVVVFFLGYGTAFTDKKYYSPKAL